MPAKKTEYQMKRIARRIKRWIELRFSPRWMRDYEKMRRRRG